MIPRWSSPTPPAAKVPKAPDAQQIAATNRAAVTRAVRENISITEAALKNTGSLSPFRRSKGSTS